MIRISIIKGVSDHFGVPGFNTYSLKYDLDPICDIFGLGCHNRFAVTFRIFPYFMILDVGCNDRARTGTCSKNCSLLICLWTDFVFTVQSKILNKRYESWACWSARPTICFNWHGDMITAKSIKIHRCTSCTTARHVNLKEPLIREQCLYMGAV